MFFRPTKLGTRGPQSCNESLVFNIDVLSSIKDKLNEYWPEMEEMPTITKKVNSLSSAASPTNQNTWFYQWTNHGTCAASIPALNSEFKYFNQGIEWAEKYNMNDILEKSGIKVSSKLYVKDYWKAVKSVLKKNVWIQCLYKHVSIIFYNSEIFKSHTYVSYLVDERKKLFDYKDIFSLLCHKKTMKIKGHSVTLTEYSALLVNGH